MREKNKQSALLLASIVFLLGLSACNENASDPQSANQTVKITPSQQFPSGTAIPTLPVATSKPSAPTVPPGGVAAPAPASTPAWVATAEQIAFFSQVAKAGNLTCSSPEQCEPSVAMISIVTQTGIQRCTGFLIGSDQVMTSDHCVSQNPLVLQSCQNKVFFHFSKTDRDEVQTVGCDSIQVRSHEKGLYSKDYLIFKMDHALQNRRPVKWSKRGLRSNEKVIIATFEKKSTELGSHDGVQVLQACTATYHTVLYPAVKSGQSALMSFGDCLIHKGNSGAAVFNEDGEVAAVLQGFDHLNEKDPKTVEAFKKISLDDSFGLMAIATQTHCMNEISPETASKCVGPFAQEKVGLQTYLNQFSFKTGSDLPTPPDSWYWKVVMAPSTSQWVLVSFPVCVDLKKGAQFNSRVLVYRRGLNRAMKGEWKMYAPEKKSYATYVLTPPIAAGAKITHWTNSGMGSVDLKVCEK